MKRWDQQNMGRCLRINVIESDNVFVAQNDVSGDLTFNNFAEDAVGI
jgi:hypothetical protein